MNTLMATTTAVLLIAFAPTQAAQEDGGGPAAQQRVEQIQARLQLTPEQVERVRPLLTDEMQKLGALRDRYSDGSGNRRARLKLAREARDIQNKTDDQLKRILSKSQMDELKKIRDERRQQLRERSNHA